MEPIDQSISQDHLPLKLFLDDLERIEQILKDSCSSATFETEGFRFGSLEELTSKIKKSRLETLHIKVNSPYVTIELTKNWARLYVGSSKDQSAGIFFKIEQILSARVRPLKWLYSYIFVSVLTVGCLFLSNIIPLKTDIRIVLSLYLILLAWLLWVAYIRLRHHSTIVLKRKEEQGSFIERNKDNLAVAVIAAIAGAFLAIIGTILVGYIKK